MNRANPLYLCAVIVGAPKLSPEWAAFLGGVCILLAVYFDWKQK